MTFLETVPPLMWFASQWRQTFSARRLRSVVASSTLSIMPVGRAIGDTAQGAQVLELQVVYDNCKVTDFAFVGNQGAGDLYGECGRR